MIIRKAQPNDMSQVLELIQELAVFEKEPDAVVVTVDDLVRDGFSENPLFHCFVAEVNNDIIGIALYYYRYSTWKGKTIHLEDLVKELVAEIDLAIYQGVDTIGGAMAKVLGRVPIPGSHFMFGVWKVTAERPIGRRRRISSMIIERTEDQSEDEL